MTTLNKLSTYRQQMFGAKVDRAAASLPQTAQTAYFTVAGGRVLVTAIIGEVTTIIQGQAQRDILELRFPYEGKYMFHAHKTEFAELGWMGMFEVV